MVNETAIGGGAREFPATRWTLIVSSREGEKARRSALDELLTIYWKPLYFYLRRKGRNVEAAKDAIQGFFAQLLERDFLSRLDPAKGRFRSFLRAALDHYLINEHERASAQKRGGGAKTLSLDFDAAERDLPRTPQSPQSAYDREWALGVLARATAALEREFKTGVRGGPFDVFLRFFNLGDAPSYEQAAGDSGMSVAQFKAFLHRTRVRYRELVLAEVIQTVPDAAEAEGELGELMKALQR